MDQFQLKAFSSRTLLWGALFLLLLAAAASDRAAPAAQAQTAPEPVDIAGFELLDGDTGWVWHGHELDWTDDGGLTWRRITPNVRTRARLAAVHFADSSLGWALLRTTQAEAQSSVDSPLVLATTQDAGANWRQQPLPVDLAATLQTAKALHALPLNTQQGWIAASLAQSSNFSRGALWYTADGGATWQERSLPLGEPPQFTNALEGWLAGGPRSAAFWRTQDGGVTWQQLTLPPAAAPAEEVKLYTPLFTADGQDAVLPLLVRSEAAQAARWLASSDGGATWQMVGGLAGVAAAGSGPLYAVDARAWLVAHSGMPPLPPVQPLPYFANSTLNGDLRLVQVKMSTAQAGWALAQTGARATTLLATGDGGQTWQARPLPPTAATAEQITAGQIAAAQTGAAPLLAPLATGSRTAIVQGAGFDICDLPTLFELAAWRTASPYRIVNLYLGGSLRYCDNERLTAANIAQLSAAGWTFIPTWVGPQAPCSFYSRRFSLDPVTAYAEGGAEAQAALNAARMLGLSEADGSGTIVYYDMESFDDAGENCVAAAQAFVSGWTDSLHQSGSQAGLYGSACNPRINRFAAIASPPDAVWVAQWNRAAYDPSMSVWGVACLDNTLWSRSQRIRQYTGGHDETWGGVTLNIDSNVVDGIVANPGRVVTPPTPAPTFTPTPTPTPTPQPVVVVETPGLLPPYAGGMCGAGWHAITSGRGQPAYLAANRETNGTIPPSAAPLTAQWIPTVPSSGSYQVEAWIPAHGAIAWQCPSTQLPSDTASARYTVQYAAGEQITVTNQAAANGGWLRLGVYPLQGGLPLTITLSTATDEAANTRTVAAGALRLTRLADRRELQFLYLPQISR